MNDGRTIDPLEERDYHPPQATTEETMKERGLLTEAQLAGEATVFVTIHPNIGAAKILEVHQGDRQGVYATVQFLTGPKANEIMECWVFGSDQFEMTVPVQNSNCLEGMRCPGCKSIGPFSIEMIASIELSDDGTEPHGDTDWDDQSAISCCQCNHYCGTVKEFCFPYNCGNCGTGFEEEDIESLPVPFAKIPNLLERIAPGEQVPFGECPFCGSLVHST